MSWTCPKCERDLPWTDFRHYCKRVSLDALFEGRSEELVLVFDKILAEVGYSGAIDHAFRKRVQSIPLHFDHANLLI